eukprot:6212220-Pleurochrysis_carterae.AAC.4
MIVKGSRSLHTLHTGTSPTSCAPPSRCSSDMTARAARRVHATRARARRRCSLARALPARFPALPDAAAAPALLLCQD